ncbi:hypothetical protein NQ318_013215 [Aromia moschata]|uniref:Uncharacterized protein n=1 Tax=Aromia moschata TaxID=1265417 RepID=A0AAV8XIP7_9CUCU|nr:hypothetical protein NQ318_013215 [Aromia moschata]
MVNCCAIKCSNRSEKKEEGISFHRRYNLSIEKPENVEFAHRKLCDPFIIRNYFNLLKTTIEELELQEKPHLIWNLDKISFCSDPTQTKVVGAIGVCRENTSVLFAFNANGGKAPPSVGNERPLLLIYDCHVTHVGINVI